MTARAARDRGVDYAPRGPGGAECVFRRPKPTVKATDPDREARLAAIEAAVAAHPKAPRLYEDECDVHLLPVVRGQYQRREIPTPGTNCKQPVFGFLNVRTGAWHYWLTARKRSVEFVICLHELEQIYPEGQNPSRGR